MWNARVLVYLGFSYRWMVLQVKNAQVSALPWEDNVQNGYDLVRALGRVFVSFLVVSCRGVMGVGKFSKVWTKEYWVDCLSCVDLNMSDM